MPRFVCQTLPGLPHEIRNARRIARQDMTRARAEMRASHMVMPCFLNLVSLKSTVIDSRARAASAPRKGIVARGRASAFDGRCAFRISSKFLRNFRPCA